MQWFMYNIKYVMHLMFYHFKVKIDNQTFGYINTNFHLLIIIFNNFRHFNYEWKHVFHITYACLNTNKISVLLLLKSRSKISIISILNPFTFNLKSLLKRNLNRKIPFNKHQDLRHVISP